MGWGFLYLTSERLKQNDEWVDKVIVLTTQAV